jgi:hypothetical protein
MTSPIPSPIDQPEQRAPESPADRFDVFVSEVLPEGIGDVIEAVHEFTASPLELAEEHLNHVGELQMESVHAQMNNDPATAHALLAEADQEMRDSADALHHQSE